MKQELQDENNWMATLEKWPTLRAHGQLSLLPPHWTGVHSHQSKIPHCQLVLHLCDQLLPFSTATQQQT